MIVRFPHRTEYHNEDGQLHRDDGPSVIYANGREEWYQNGQLHREDGPAINTYRVKNGTKMDNNIEMMDLP